LNVHPGPTTYISSGRINEGPRKKNSLLKKVIAFYGN